MSGTEQPALPPGLVLVGGKPMPLAEAEKALVASARWFWWIAGLSLVNSVAATMNAKFAMMLGLGITQLLDAIFLYGDDGNLQQVSTLAHVVHLALVLVPAAVLFYLGLRASKGSRRAFIVGMVLYALDGALFALGSDWVGLGFHVFVLVMLWGGMGMATAVREGRAANAKAALEPSPEATAAALAE